jgi:hypothetical protein
MIIIGNKDIPYTSISVIQDKRDIEKTQPNSVVVFSYDVQLLKYCYENNLKCAVYIQNIKEAIFANSLEALYIVVQNNNSSSIQKIAENYMFDSKVLQIIQDDNMIEEVALKGIDGVIYKDLLKDLL